MVVIVITNPFTAQNSGVESGVFKEYNKIKLISDFNKLSLSERQGLAEEYLDIAQQMARHDSYDKAIELTNKAVELGYNRYYIYNDLASIYLSRALYRSSNNIAKVKQSKDFKEALELCNLNIKENPELPESYDGLINTYVYIKDYDKAITTAKHACFANPQFVNRCKKVADLYILNGQRQQAIDFYLDLANRFTNIDKTWIYKRLGAIYNAHGNCSQANKYFKMVYKLKPTHENLEALIQTCYDKSLAGK